MTLVRKMAPLAGAALVLSAVACSSSSSQAPAAATGSGGAGSYKIDFIGDLSGADSVNGQSASNGFEAYIKQLNAAGGVNGHQVTVNTYDTQSTQAGGEAAGRQAIQDSPTGTVFGGSSDGVAAIAPLFSAAGNLAMVAAASGPDPAPSWFFETTTSPAQLNADFVGRAKELLGGSLRGKKVALEGVNVAFVAQAWATLIPELKADGATVSTEKVTINQISFTSQAAQVAAFKPDVILSLDTEPDTATVVKALLTAGVTAPFLASESDSDGPFMSKLNAPNYEADTTEKPAVDSPAFQAAGKKYNIDLTGANSTQGWVLGGVVQAALTACGYPCSSSQFLATLNKLDSVTPTGGILWGPLSFSATDHMGVGSSQFVSWNSSTGTVVPDGSPISVKGVG